MNGIGIQGSLISFNFDNTFNIGNKKNSCFMIISASTGLAFTIAAEFQRGWKPYMTFAKGVLGQRWFINRDKKYKDQFSINSFLLPQVALDRGDNLLSDYERSDITIEQEKDALNQKWRFYRSASDKDAFKIQSVFDGKVFDAGEVSFEDKHGKELWVWPQHQGVHQNFYLVPINNDFFKEV